MIPSNKKDSIKNPISFYFSSTYLTKCSYTLTYKIEIFLTNKSVTEIHYIYFKYTVFIDALTFFKIKYRKEDTFYKKFKFNARSFVKV